MPMSNQSRSRALRHMVVLAGLFFLAFTRPAYAYIDPLASSVTAIVIFSPNRTSQLINDGVPH